MFYPLLVVYALLSSVGVSGSSRPLHQRGSNVVRQAAAAEVYCPMLENPPKNRICGKTGHLKKRPPNFLSDMIYTDTRRECQDRCLRWGACQSFGYDAARGECYFYMGDLQKHKFNYTKAPGEFYPIRYWSRYCYDCSERCPQPLRTNLIENGGFDDSATSIQPWYGSGADVAPVAPGYNSPYAYRYAFRGGERNTVNLYHSFDSCPGSTYQLRLDYKVTFPNPNAVGMLFINVGTIFLIKGTFENDTWTTFQSYFTESTSFSTTEAEIEFELSNVPFNSGGRPYEMEFILDNIEVVRVEDEATVKPGAKELLINGGFETGKIRPWNVFELDPYGTSTGIKPAIVSPGVDSAYALSVLGAKYPDTSEVYFAQDLATKPGAQYLLTFDYLSNQYAVISIVPGGFQPVKKTFLEYTTIARRGMVTRFQGVFVAQQNSTLVIGFEREARRYEYSRTRVRVDNFSIKEIVP